MACEQPMEMLRMQIQNKRRVIAMILNLKRGLSFLLVLGMGFLCTGCMKEEPVELDAFKNMKIHYSGWNHSGKAEVENKIQYTGNDETIIDFIDSISYKIQPNKNLSNGDSITVKVVYTKDLYKLANVEFKSEQKKFKVHGLEENEREVITNTETVESEDGNEEKKTTQSYVYDGVEIPASWNLTEEEKQQYIAYMKGIQNDTQMDESGVQENWMQGESEQVTKRKDADFLVKDYLDNAVSCYEDAFAYGNTSSQKFKIEPIIEKEQMIGYRCIFKEE